MAALLDQVSIKTCVLHVLAPDLLRKKKKPDRKLPLSFFFLVVRGFYQELESCKMFSLKLVAALGLGVTGEPV